MSHEFLILILAEEMVAINALKTTLASHASDLSQLKFMLTKLMEDSKKITKALDTSKKEKLN